MSRPKLGFTHTSAVRLRPETHEALLQAASEQGLSVATLTRLILESWLKQKTPLTIYPPDEEDG